LDNCLSPQYQYDLLRYNNHKVTSVIETAVKERTSEDLSFDLVASVLHQMLDEASLFISGGKFMPTVGRYMLPHNEGEYRVHAPLVITSRPFDLLQEGHKPYASYGSYVDEVNERLFTVSMVTSGSGLAYEHPHLWYRRPTFHCSTGWYDFFSS